MKIKPNQARIVGIGSLDIREKHTHGTSHSNNISSLKHPKNVKLVYNENEINRGEKEVKIELGVEIEW